MDDVRRAGRALFETSRQEPETNDELSFWLKAYGVSRDYLYMDAPVPDRGSSISWPFTRKSGSLPPFVRLPRFARFRRLVRHRGSATSV